MILLIFSVWHPSIYCQNPFSELIITYSHCCRYINEGFNGSFLIFFLTHSILKPSTLPSLSSASPLPTSPVFIISPSVVYGCLEQQISWVNLKWKSKAFFLLNAHLKFHSNAIGGQSRCTMEEMDWRIWEKKALPINIAMAVSRKAGQRTQRERCLVE